MLADHGHNRRGEKRMKKWIYGLIAAAITGVCGYAISHPGGLDMYGCHTDTKTGIYHCHKFKP